MSQGIDKHNTDLDQQLQKLAASNWPRFVELLGEKNITKAKVCLLKGRGKSITQISSKLSLTRRQAQWRCGKC